MSIVPAAASSSSERGQDLPFEECCKCFELLVKPSTDAKLRPGIMERLWKAYGIREHPLFELMRLIVPNLDTVRPMYRMKQKMIGKMYVEILAINESSEDAQALLNWKKPASGFQRN